MMFPYIPAKKASSDQGLSSEDQLLCNAAEGSSVVPDKKASAPLSHSTGINSASSSGPEFKDQLREVEAPTLPIVKTSAREIPIADAVLANPVASESNDTASIEHQQKLLELEERRFRLERERMELQQQQQESSGSGFNKKKWAIVGLLTFLVVLVASLAVVFATGNKSSSDPPGVQQASGTDVPQPTPQPVVSPLPLPNTERATEFLNFVNSITLTMRTLSYPSDSTPEELALQWLVDKDVGTDVSVSATVLTQRYVLATLWFGNGPFTPPHEDTWISDTDECNWLNIICTNGEVVSIVLQSAGAERNDSCRYGITHFFAVHEFEPE